MASQRLERCPFVLLGCLLVLIDVHLHFLAGPLSILSPSQPVVWARHATRSLPLQEHCVTSPIDCCEGHGRRLLSIFPVVCSYISFCSHGFVSVSVCTFPSLSFSLSSNFFVVLLSFYFVTLRLYVLH